MTDVSSSIVFLPTSDLDSVKSFFSETIGLRLALDQGTCLIFEASKASYWGFCSSAEPPREGHRTMLTLVVDTEEAVIEAHRVLAERGASTDGPPRLNPRYSIFHFFIDATDGYRVEVQTFLDPNWPGKSDAQHERR